MQTHNSRTGHEWFESFPEAVFVIAPDGIIRQVNEAFATRFGINPQDLVGQNIYDVTSPEISSQRKKKVEEVLQTSRPLSWEDERDARTLRNTIYPYFSPEGNVDQLLTVSQDVTDFKRSEKALNASTERLRLIMAETHAGSWEWELSTNINIWSDELWQLYGLEKYSGVPSFELWLQSIIPEDRHKTEKAVMSAAKKGAEFTIEWRVCGRDGELRWLMSKGVPFKDTDGQVCRYVGIVLDITARMRTEEKLRKSEERFRKMFESHSAVMIILDPETGNFIDANQAAEDFYGWSAEELKLMRIQQITNVTPQEVKENFDKIRSSYQNRFLFRHRRADDSVRDVEVFSKNIEIAGKELIYSIIHDVTERMRFASITDFHHYLLEVEESNSAELILQLAVDEIEKLTGSNSGFYKLLNDNRFTLLLHDLSTNSRDDVYRIESKGMQCNPHETDVWADAIREKKTVIFNGYGALRYRTDMPDHNPEVRREMITPVIQGEQVIAILGVRNKPNDYEKEDARCASAIANIASDIVTRKLSRQSEIRMQEALIQSQKMDMVGQLAGGIAHDFNNMLTVILGHTEIALEKPAAAYGNLESIQKAAHHSAELIHQLLAFARKQTIIPKVLDLNAKVDGMLSMLRHLIGENITLTWVPKTQNARVKFDPSQIDQILANLCINARDAIDGTGNIIIETNNIHINKTEIEAGHPCTIPGDYVILAITDNGKGIDKKHLPHIFEPFFTTKEVGKGTGMGLSTVYGIVKQNSGYIDFQSEADKGTSFRIYLPFHRYHDFPEASRSSDPVLIHGTETILLVEDQPEILKLYRQMLVQKGYTVLAAARPSEAIRLAEQYKELIDLLITDVIMPEMNGSELFKQLQTAAPNLKVLFMSGYTADFIARHNVFDEGVNFIEKPFTVNTLTKILQEILKPG